MTTPDPNQNEPSKLKKIMNSPTDDSILSRLPRGNGVRPPTPPTRPPAQSLPAQNPAAPTRRTIQSLPARNPAPPTPAKPVEDKAPRWRWKFLPAFWTIASVMTFTVNIVVLIVLLMLVQNRGSVNSIANGQANQLLGGLYNNFVLMDQAHIRTNIHVEKQIPVRFDLNVSAPADVTLREDALIEGALVTVATGGLNIVNARARIVLPAGTPLKVNIGGLVVPVDQQVLAVLDVPVDIPLSQTELHQPFVGLQKVVEPWYCLSQPNALVNGVRVCDTVANPLAPVFDVLNR